MNKKIIAKKTNNFWNDEKIIKIFANQAESKYWISFFKSQQNRTKKKVLDLGCGAGRNIKMLLSLDYDVYACDLYEGMLKMAKKEYLKSATLKHIDKKISLCSMTNLPYGNNFFDIVLCHGVYHNAMSTNEFRKAIRESARVLMDGGYLCFNMFSSKFIEDDMKKVGGNLYLTKEGLLMILLSKEMLLREVKKARLVTCGPIVEYVSKVSTGKRSVMRGVFKKISNPHSCL